MLLKRLQKAENALTQARAGDDNSQEQSQSRRSLNKDEMSAEMKETFDKVDKRLQAMKREVHGAKEDCVQRVMDSVSQQINDARKSFVNSELLESRLRDDKVTGWNNIVKECSRVVHAGRRFLLVQTVYPEDDQQFYMVEESKLKSTDLKYLDAFVEEYSDAEFMGDVIQKGVAQMERDPEI